VIQRNNLVTRNKKKQNFNFILQYLFDHFATINVFIALKEKGRFKFESEPFIVDKKQKSQTHTSPLHKWQPTIYRN
jgi:hypothetical protein